MKPPPHLFLIHGTYGNPQENWFPWLKAQAEKMGISVSAPRFPTPEGQNLSHWQEVFDRESQNIPPENLILICHSIGAAFALRQAENSPAAFRALILAAPFVDPLGLPDFDDLNVSFIAAPFNWAAIRQNADVIACFAGDNDPYVPQSFSKKVADHAGASLALIPQGGHLNKAAGFTQFSDLWDFLSGLWKESL